jgi:hypothetical protein
MTRLNPSRFTLRGIADNSKDVSTFALRGRASRPLQAAWVPEQRPSVFGGKDHLAELGLGVGRLSPLFFERFGLGFEVGETVANWRGFA